MVCTMRITDPDTYRKYTALTPAIVERHGGRFLTRGDEVVTVEGETFTDRMVILEFPDRQAAQGWYDDPAYQDASQFRRAASSAGRMMLQAGRTNTGNPDPIV